MKEITCPMTQSDVIDQCKTCEYNKDCLEDILNDFEQKVLVQASKTVKKVRAIIKEHEKSSC